MTNFELKSQIDKNNALIQKLLDPTQFTLSEKICKLLKENEELQAQCEHSYVNGICTYCYKEVSK